MLPRQNFKEVMRPYTSPEAIIEGQKRCLTTSDNYDTRSYVNPSTEASVIRSSSSSSTNDNGGIVTKNVVSFGTVTLREYERKLNVQADVDLGLTIGWKFLQHPPIDVDSFTRDRADQKYRGAESTSEGERAKLLLESGYSKRRLRSAIRRRHRQLDDAMRIPHSILSGPSRIVQKISNVAKSLLPSYSVEDTIFFY
jgi:hypothetical protein